MDDGRLREVYDDFASAYWIDSFVSDRLGGVAGLRRDLLAGLGGRVLDLATGTGQNAAHLGAAEAVVAVDLSPAMLARAQSRFVREGITVAPALASAGDLPFRDGAFDAVTSALSTCTFPDPVRALQEMARVVVSEGEVLLVEHGRSRVEGVARFQDRRAARHAAKAGCRWNQSPVALARAAGLQVVDVDTRRWGVFVAIRARPV